MAPNLKGRPRKKKPCPQRRDSLSGIKDSNNNCDNKAVAKGTPAARNVAVKGSFTKYLPEKKMAATA
ncbi:UNVERIFIED_CONTAM: AT-rich interactive domain-containing protein 5B [Gekko kuhli]